MFRGVHDVVEHVTVAEAAERLQISERAIRQRVYRGSLPHRYDGKRLLIQVEERVPRVPSPDTPPVTFATPPPTPTYDADAVIAMLHVQISDHTRVIESMQRDHAREVQELHVLLQNAQRLIPATVPDAPHAAERAADDVIPHAEATIAPGGAQRESEASWRVRLRRWMGG